MAVSIINEYMFFSFYDIFDEKGITKKITNMPFVTYPNDVPCDEVNMFLRKIFENGSAKVSTLTSYAYNLIHLVDFCYKNKLPFHRLSDSSFTLFVQGLQAERDTFGQVKRGSNRVRDIATRCLMFLESVQIEQELKNFIGEGNQYAIKIKFKETKVKLEGRPDKFTIARTHTSMPSPEPKRKNYPASNDDMLTVWDYICRLENRELRERNKALYQCLEYLGARRLEVSLMTVQDIKDAILTDDAPSLKINTVKRAEGTLRYIPIPSGILANINQYITIRKKIINRTLKKHGLKDHGFLFVSSTTGKPLSEKTITSLLNDWAKAVGIKGKFHPHQFRHSFITRKLVEIILANNINNTDDFRRTLLNQEKFKIQLKEWSGHSNISSLETYIHLAFAEIVGYSKTYNAVRLNDAVKAMEQTLAELEGRIANKSILTTEALIKLKQSITYFKSDLDSSLDEMTYAHMPNYGP